MFEFLRLLLALIFDVVQDLLVSLRFALEGLREGMRTLIAGSVQGVFESIDGALPYALIAVVLLGSLVVVAACLASKWIVWSIRAPGSSGPVTSVES